MTERKHSFKYIKELVNVENSVAIADEMIDVVNQMLLSLGDGQRDC